MQAVLRMFLAALAVTSASATLPACSGGGGGSSEPQGPPPLPFVITSDTGLAIGLRFEDVAVIGTWAIVPVSEAETGADLNGDGDRFDSVAHLLDITNNVATNLGLALLGKPATSDQQFAFLVPETDQQSDLNGDGDQFDSVWYLLNPAFDISAANPLNTGLSTPLSGKPGIGAVGGLVLVVSEFSMGADLSGDGDMIDDVVFAVEQFGQSIVPLGIPPYAPGTALIADGNRILVCGSEVAFGADLTGDNDTTDIILGAVAFDGPGLPRYTPIGGGAPRAIDPRAYAFTDRMVVFLVSEVGSGGTDLNGDGDSNDSVLSLMDIETGSGEQLPLASGIGFSPLAVSVITGFGTSGSRVLFGIDEGGQQQDLNTDQDTADSILAWIDTQTAPSVVHVVGLTLGSHQPVIDGTVGLISINEAASALVVGVDHNADGDINDQVAFRIDVSSAPAVLRNLGRAVAGFTLTGTDAILLVPEAAQSGIDRNGDTDTNDVIPVYSDLGRTSPIFKSLGLATHAHALVRTASNSVRLALTLPEQPLTSRADLNGDGDSADNAYMWFDLDTAAVPPVVTPPTPYLIGIGAFSTVAPIVVDAGTLLFVTSEAMLGRDLNDDGDADDTLLRIVKRAEP